MEVDYEYTIFIKNNDDEITGQIHEFNEETLKENSSDFNPISVINEITANKIDEDVFTKQENIKAFGFDLGIKYDKTFYYFIDEIRNIIKNNKKLSITHLKKLKDSFNLYIDIDITDNGYYYTCYSITAIIYALMYYLLENSYRIDVCRHCELFFVTKSRINPPKFCNRNSPYDNYENFTCGIAVDKIRDNLRWKRKGIENYLNNRYKDYDERLKKVGDFSDRCTDYNKSIKKEPTIANIKKYDEFLDKQDKYRKLSKALNRKFQKSKLKK